MQVLVSTRNRSYDPIDEDATHFGHRVQRNRVEIELGVVSLLAGICGAKKVLCRIFSVVYQWSLSAVGHVCCTILTCQALYIHWHNGGLTIWVTSHSVIGRLLHERRYTSGAMNLVKSLWLVESWTNEIVMLLFPLNGHAVKSPKYVHP